ncbi:MAG: ABC transporter permease [Chloroflexota bacterium]
MPPNAINKRPSAATQLLDLTLIQLSNFRWAWRSTLLTGIVAPLLSLMGLGLFARDAGAEALAYVLTGNVVMALMFENLNRVSSNFAYMKAMGTLTYFATLPVRRSLLVLATLLAFFLLSLPATLVTILFGSWFLGVTLHVSPFIVVVVPLTAVPLAALGAFIGLKMRSPAEAGPVTTLIVFLFISIGPVIFPPSRLPSVMQSIGRLSPATYAASALRQTLLGPATPQLAIDLAVLLFVAVILSHLVNRTNSQ